jgi:hypothetical protein
MTSSLVAFDAAIENGITSMLCLGLTSMVSISKFSAAKWTEEVMPIMNMIFAAIKLGRTVLIN